MVEDQSVGALKLYSRGEASFAEEQEQVGLAFASQAAVAMANAQAYWEAKDVADQLGEAMKSRAVIEQARGILMAAQGCTADDAFDRWSRRRSGATASCATSPRTWSLIPSAGAPSRRVHPHPERRPGSTSPSHSGMVTASPVEAVLVWKGPGG